MNTNKEEWKNQEYIKLRLVPVDVFGAKNGYGLMDAVSAWSDCNRAIGKIYRIDDVEKKYRNKGETVEILIKKEDIKFFNHVWVEE